MAVVIGVTVFRLVRTSAVLPSGVIRTGQPHCLPSARGYWPAVTPELRRAPYMAGRVLTGGGVAAAPVSARRAPTIPASRRPAQAEASKQAP